MAKSLKKVVFDHGEDDNAENEGPEISIVENSEKSLTTAYFDKT